MIQALYQALQTSLSLEKCTCIQSINKSIWILHSCAQDDEMAKYAGVIEAWAAGSSWTDIMKDSSLDDGDIARLLSRTVDVLRHAHFCDGLLINTRIAARKAMRAMNRNPIADLVQ